MSLKLHVVSAGTGKCSFSGKPDSDGLTVAFENEAPAFLSWKAFRQLLGYKAGQNGRPDVKPAPAAVPTSAVTGQAPK